MALVRAVTNPQNAVLEPLLFPQTGEPGERVSWVAGSRLSMSF